MRMVIKSIPPSPEQGVGVYNTACHLCAQLTRQPIGGVVYTITIKTHQKRPQQARRGNKGMIQMSRKEYYKMYEDARRGTRERAFYNSKAWKQTRDIVRERDNHLCQRCLTLGKITPSDLVHHKIEITDDWDKRLELDNLVCLCNSCHQYEHSNLQSTADGLEFDENGDLIRIY